MKKIFTIFFASLVLFSSCTKEDDPVFDKTPEERLRGTLSEYKTKLTNEDGLWITYYYGNAILMKFSQDNTVEFQSTFNGGLDDRTITYRVGASQVPELIFENHSVFHAIYEQNLNEAEYEFLFDKIHDNQIDFISKTDLGANKTKLSFFKATSEDLVAYEKMNKNFGEMSFFKTLLIEGTDFNADFINFPGEVTLKFTNTEGINQVTKHPFEVTKNGLLFNPSVEINGALYSSFVYDEASSQFVSEGDGPKAIIAITQNIPKSEAGIYEEYLGVNYRILQVASYQLRDIMPAIKTAAPWVRDFFFWSDGYSLCHAPGFSGGNWSGWIFNYQQLPEDNNQLLVTWDYRVYGNWWQTVLNNPGGQKLQTFMLDPKGLYIYRYKENSFVIISNSDPSQYLLVE